MRTRNFTILDRPVSELGFGGANIGNLREATSSQKSLDLVAFATEQNVSHFDTAPHYGAGLSETRLGMALYDSQTSDTIVSTKVGRRLVPDSRYRAISAADFEQASPFVREFDYSYDGVMRSVDDSLNRMGRSQFDILYMHDIGRVTHGYDHDNQFRIAMNEGFRAMSELKSQGVVQAIGVGANEWEVCERTLDYADFDCFMVANAFTLLDHTILERFEPECAKRNKSLVVAAPFASGILVTGSRKAGSYKYQPPTNYILQKVAALEELCSIYNVPLQALAIQFPLKYQTVKSVVVGMREQQEITQNIEWYQYAIPEDCWQAVFNLLGLDCQAIG
ncbi:aldo/keto reductase [Vibrio amylolyticus]|uniref:aldo/keto reductase n=1 Tax=Vibrio amylolyticus TaxID=2847292 RepID=UPI00354E7411